MDEGTVRLAVDGEVATLTFDRPEARGAMTFAMYRELAAACARIADTPALRVAVLRGAPGAFVAGTDIGEFAAFATGEDGIAYEERVEAVIAGLEALPVPTLAVIDGAAVGGGLAIAVACDLRLVTPRARLGVPIARTLGNCLSLRNVARLERAFGLGAARRMLLLSELLDGEAAARAGFAIGCVEPGDLEARTQGVVDTLRAAAPLTIEATRETLRRIGRGESGDADIIAGIYGSGDFREGVRAFLDKRKADWQRR
ncbi:enoyl-CoA hydratase [soil metagenome]